MTFKLAVPNDKTASPVRGAWYHLRNGLFGNMQQETPKVLNVATKTVITEARKIIPIRIAGR